MSTIFDEINLQLNESLKSRNEVILASLRMLKSVLKNKEIEKKTPLTDNEIIDVLYSEIKKRKESAELYKKAGRKDLSDKEEGEIKIISGFLPKQLDDDELTNIVSSAIAEVGATSPADMGKIMAVVMPKVKGEASGFQVSQKVLKLLNK
ncbi:GatB/YqeY domain-containing protein [bacterium]|nr:GatB/YqeY domain-containing protein [bacterium]